MVLVDPQRRDAQHGLHRRPAQLRQVHRRRRDLANHQQLARAVRPALRARRSSRRRVHDAQGRSRAALRHRRRAVPQHRRRPHVQQPEERRHLVISDLRADRQPEASRRRAHRAPGRRHAIPDGQTGTYNQVFGGDGFGVGWSQADDLVSLGKRLLLVHHPERQEPSEHAGEMARGLQRDRRVLQPGARPISTPRSRHRAPRRIRRA